MPLRLPSTQCAAQDCSVAFRDKWLFTARVCPAEQHPGLQEAAAPSHINGDPFEWEPQPVAPFDFEMQDGVFRVYDDAAHTSEPFPVPGNSFDFFSDMSRYTATDVFTAVSYPPLTTYATMLIQAVSRLQQFPHSVGMWCVCMCVCCCFSCL